MLDGGNKIILANWPNNKHIICNTNNDLPIEIPSHPYVLINRIILCYSGIEAENNFLLESLAAWHDSNTKLIMYFTVKNAFTNYEKSMSQTTLPIFLNKSTFDDTLLSAKLILKEYIAQYKLDKEIFDLKERHDIDKLETEFVSKNFFTNNFIIDVFVFVIAIILVISTILIIYTICKHNKLRTLVKSLALCARAQSWVTQLASL